MCVKGFQIHILIHYDKYLSTTLSTSVTCLSAYITLPIYYLFPFTVILKCIDEKFYIEK